MKKIIHTIGLLALSLLCYKGVSQNCTSVIVPQIVDIGGALEQAQDFLWTNDGNLVITGYTSSSTTKEDGLILKISPTGNLIWAYTIGGISNERFQKIKPCKDGGFILVGSSFSFGANESCFLVKITDAGLVSWARIYDHPLSSRGYDVVETKDGGYACVGFVNNIDKSGIMRTDANGQPIWGKVVDGSINDYFFTLDETSDGGFLAAGSGISFAVGLHDFSLVRFESDGDILWQKQLGSPQNDGIYNLKRTPDNGFILTGNTWEHAQGENNSIPLIKIDAHGNVVWAKQYGIDGANYSSFDVELSPSGGYLIAANEHFDGPRDFLLEVDNQGGVNSIFGFDHPYDVKFMGYKSSDNGCTAAVGRIDDGGAQNLFVWGVNLVPCRINPEIFVDELPLIAMNASFDVSNWTSSKIVSPTVKSLDLKSIAICPCTAPTLNLGPDITLCHDSTVVFDAGPGFSAYHWQDNSAAQTFAATAPGVYWVEVTDSCGNTQRDSVLLSLSLLVDVKLSDTSLCAGSAYTLSVPGFASYAWVPATGLSCTDCATPTVQPLVTTTYTLAATNADGCIATDTFTVEVLSPGPTLNLGPDITLCHDSTVVFDAGPGFSAYHWQDNSAAQTFAATAPGVYWVEVTDSCGNTQRDSVLLSLSLLVDVKLSDTSLCAGSAYTLSVPGFASYAWVPATGLSCTDCATPTVQPLVTTTYTLAATNADGCIATDTFTVEVLSPGPTLNLGPDITLCHDSTVVFDADPGFSAYHWQDNSAAQTFAATAPGVYWVEVTDSCGNTQRDSVLLSLSLLVDVKLSDTSLCAGIAYTLSVPGFASYAWAPATGLSCTDCATPTVQPLVTTMYTLAATNADGCLILDTFTTSILPLPLEFDTLEFCLGDTIIINGQPFSQPGTFVDTVPVLGACDKIITYTLQYISAPDSKISVDCVPDINIATLAGTGFVPVNYDLPTVKSDCPCPGIALTQLEGLPPGGLFPVAKTRVCYEARDSCGNIDTCCFYVFIREALPCDSKEIGCMRYELLRITQNAAKERTYYIRVTNKCATPLIYTAFELPAGTVAVEPDDNSIFATPANREYLVRNPNASPFYSIRFKSTSDSLANNESDIFTYTLPPQSEPDYIHVTSRVFLQQFFEAYLNTFNCPILQEQKPALHNISLPRLRLFPNPTSGLLLVDLARWSSENVQIRILDATGRPIQHFSMVADTAPQEIQIAQNLPDGFYFLEVQPETGVRLTECFAVQH